MCGRKLDGDELYLHAVFADLWSYSQIHSCLLEHDSSLLGTLAVPAQHSSAIVR